VRPWPLASRAQQPAIPVLGMLHGGSPEADAFRAEAIQQGLKETGYVEGQNLAIVHRWAESTSVSLTRFSTSPLSPQQLSKALVCLPGGLRKGCSLRNSGPNQPMGQLTHVHHRG